MSAPFDRPTSEPGGCVCDECGVVFVGAEGHDLCAICNARHEAAISALQAILKPLGTNLRHYEAWSRNPAIEAMKAEIAKAMMAERERCAEIAVHLKWSPSTPSKNSEAISQITADWGRKIAAAIRSPQPSPPKGA